MRLKKLVLLLFIFVFLASSASGMAGVSPGSYDINFKPYLKGTYHFDFITDAGKKFDISLQGDLAQYATLSDKTLDSGGRIYVYLKLPREVEVPGQHTLYVAAQERPEPGKRGVSTVVNVKGIINVYVPYPNQYAEVELVAPNIKSGEVGIFNVRIKSMGVETLYASSQIEIYDARNKTVAILPLENSAIESTKSRDFEVEWDTTNFKAGLYKAKAITFYNGRNASVQASFRIGELFVDVTNHSNNLLRNQINKFDVHIESFWNDPIQSVFAEVTLLDYGISFKTPSVDLKGFDKVVLQGYFDTTGIPEDADSFRAKIAVNYAGKINEKLVEVHFYKKINYLMIGLVIGVIAAILILLGIIFLLKRMEKKNAKQIKKK